MMKLIRYHPTQTGFTLVEMAIVLAIVALLLGGLLPTISSQIEQQHRNNTRKQLDEIKESLIGYTIINGSLPCPTTTTDPASASYGVADATCSANATVEGYLPWKTLGVAETDAWGIKRKGSGDPWIGQWRYRVDRNFAITFSLSTVFSAADALLIKDNSGNSITTTTERPIAIVFSTGKNLTADGENASFEPTSGIYQSDVPSSAFDDMLIWLSRPQLFNRMVAAGKLP
jgi:prepilin-type N-terminal cleavage/methylation domain-containing protein